MVINSLGPLLLEEADHEVLGWAGKQAEGDYSTTEAIRGTPAGWGHPITSGAKPSQSRDTCLPTTAAAWHNLTPTTITLHTTPG